MPRVDMADPRKLEELITDLFHQDEPQIGRFGEAALSRHESLTWQKKVAKPHKTNAPFKQTFAGFFDLYKTSRSAEDW